MVNGAETKSAGLTQAIRVLDAIPASIWNAVGLLATSPLAGAAPTVAHFAMSNIPGPRDRLYFAGAAVENVYGRTFVGAGVGLFGHCVSYAGHLDFGFTAFADLVPDPEQITAGVRRHLDLLLAAIDD